MERTVSLAVVPGDGIGPEVTAEALKVLRAATADALTIETTTYPFGAGHYLETGEVLTDPPPGTPRTRTRKGPHD